MSKQLYLLAFYIPEEHLVRVLNKIFDAGAGEYQNYDRCAWSTVGKGRYRPLKGSEPFIGNENEDCFVPEIKVECIVREEKKDLVVEVLKKEHPYEEVAYHLIPIQS